MALILGIDPSTKKIAVVAGETTTRTFHVKAGVLLKSNQKQTPESLGEALVFMRDFIEEVAHMAPPTGRFAYVEPPLVGRGGVQTAIKLGYVGGIIRGCLAEAGFQVYDASLTTWRAGTLGVKAGKGRTTKQVKDETALVVKQRDPKLHGLVSHDHDLIDAAGIWLHGAAVASRARRVAAGLAEGPVQGSGLDVVVRPPRVRPAVRRR